MIKIGLFEIISKSKKKRIERNYQEIISQYSSNDQKLINKGRKVELTFLPIKKLEEENPEKEIIPLTDSMDVKTLFVSYHFKHKPIPYQKMSLGSNRYKCDVEYWLEIGKIGADVLCSLQVLQYGFTELVYGTPIKMNQKTEPNENEL